MVVIFRLYARKRYIKREKSSFPNKPSTISGFSLVQFIVFLRSTKFMYVAKWWRYSKAYVAFILPYGISGFSYFSLSSSPMYKIAILAQGWRSWHPSKGNFASCLYSGNCERLFKSQVIRQREVLAIRVPRRLLFHVPLWFHGPDTSSKECRS